MIPATDWLGWEQCRAQARLRRVNRVAKTLAEMQDARTYSAAKAKKAVALLKRTDAQGRT
jgi:hypothetical protein